MKAYLFFLGILNVFILTGLQAQSGQIHITDRYENATHYYKGNELWINDTINYFAGNAEDWTPVKRLVVLSRDGLGQELETVLEYYDTDRDTWNARIKHLCKYYYFQDTQFMKESTTKVWNTYHKKWVKTAFKEYNKYAKLVQEEALNWDSEEADAQNGTRSIHTYHNNGELLMVENQDWNPSNFTWERKNRISSQASEDQLTFIEDTESWNANKSKWVLASRSIIKKNTEGFILSQEFITYDDRGKNQVLVNKTCHEYDDEGRVRETYRTKDLGYKKTGVREQKLYRNDGKEVKATRLAWNASEKIWMPTDESRHIYQEDLEVITQRNWDPEKETWLNTHQQIKRFDDGLLVDNTYRIWDLQEENWQYTQSERYAYEDGNLTSRLVMKWDTEQGKWLNQSQMQAEFSRHGKSFEIVKHWCDDSDDWKEDYQNEWEYDDSGNIISYEWLQMGDDQNWVLKERADFGWHMFALSKTEAKDDYTIEVFPNPTRGVLHIKSTAGTLSRIAILDQAGQLLEAISLDQASTTIDISHLPNGNYFIECNSGIQTNTFKVVKL